MKSMTQQQSSQQLYQQSSSIRNQSSTRVVSSRRRRRRVAVFRKQHHQRRRWHVLAAAFVAYCIICCTSFELDHQAPFFAVVSGWTSTTTATTAPVGILSTTTASVTIWNHYRRSDRASFDCSATTTTTSTGDDRRATLVWRRRKLCLYSSPPRSSATTSSAVAADDKEDSAYRTFLKTTTPSGGGRTSMASSSSSSQPQRITLTRYLNEVVKANPERRDLESLLLAVQMACKTISNLMNRAGLVYSPEDRKTEEEEANNADGEDNDRAHDDILAGEFADGRYYSMRRLDHLSTMVLKNALKFTGKTAVVAPVPVQNAESPAQHQPGVLIAKTLTPDSSKYYTAVLDPLDGSGNADASICTGTVFGVFQKGEDEQDDEEEDESFLTVEERTRKLVRSVLQPAKNMCAAGYCLYSSATVLVFTLGPDQGVQGFTLDPGVNEFVLTHPDLTIPHRGSVYSCNEANSEGWDRDFGEYLRAIKTGRGQTKKRYAHRYVGSMVGDIHRTLLYGGIFCYPSDDTMHPSGNLQLLYKTAPMAYVVQTAGGKAIVGKRKSLLDVRPDRVHQKYPCFLGSPQDVDELESFLQK